MPVVPYGWQAPDGVVERPSRYSSRLNVLAWLNETGEIVSHCSEKAIDSAFVIDSISQWAAQLSGPTVLVLDNAPMHRSKAFNVKLASWQAQGLFVFFLPPYSPHLNKAETLWPVRRCGKIKYEWLETAAYTTYESLKAAVEQILSEFGQTYCIQFAQKHCIINSV